MERTKDPGERPRPRGVEARIPPTPTEVPNRVGRMDPRRDAELDRHLTPRTGLRARIAALLRRL